MSKRYYGGVDLGGTKVTVLIADEEGRVVARSQEPFSGGDGTFSRFRDGTAFSGAAAQIESMLRRLLDESDVSELAGIGIGSAGPLQHGAIKNPPNICIPPVPERFPPRPLYLPLVEPLGTAFDAPTRLENDCNTAAAGEAAFGVGRDIPDKRQLHIVYVTISTGLGAGVWSGGHLLLGKEGNAAEMGHTVVKEGGLLCGCGNRGCAEAYCSGRGIVRNARLRLVDTDPNQDLPLLRLVRSAAAEAGIEDPDRDLFALLGFVTAPRVFEAAQADDPLARAVVDDAIHYGGIGLSAIANAYDPQVITLGGAIALAHPGLVNPMADEMRRHLNVTAPEVRITPLGKRAVERGAIALARKVATAV
jgi:glucokinase